MKTIYFFFTFILSMFLQLLSAQITLQSSDMPSAGDAVRNSIALNTSGFDFVSTGSDYFWDFSGLQAASQTIDTFRTVTQTPAVFWPSFFTSANLAQRMGGGEILPGVVLDDAYRFFHNSSSQYRDAGYGLIVGGIPLPLKFNNPDVVFSFPLTYGGSHSSNADLELALPGLGYISIQRNRQSQADGYGQLLTPFGLFEVLRIKSTVYERDSVYIDTAAQGGALVRNYIEYLWMAKNRDVPILQVLDDQVLGQIVTYQDSLRDLTVRVHEFHQDAVRLYPHPVSSAARFEYPFKHHHNAILQLFSSDGQIVRSHPNFNVFAGQTVYQLPWNFGEILPGMYVLHIQSDDFLLVSKIIVMH